MCVDYSNDNENVFDRSNFYAKRDSSYYLLLDSEILENIIDLIGKCPTEACTGNVNYHNDFSSKQAFYVNWNFLVQVVAGHILSIQVKKYQKLQQIKIHLMLICVLS